MNKFLAIASMAIAFSAIATAQRPMPVQKSNAQYRVAKALRAARIDRNFHIKGPWITLSQDDVNTQAVNWINGFDATDTDPSLIPNAIYNQFYGATSGLWYFGDTWNEPFVINDISVNPAASGKSATLFQMTNTWNPAGTSPPTGAADMALVVFTGHGFNPITDIMDDGWIFTFGSLAGGYWWLQVNLSGSGIGIALPAGPGNMWNAVGTISGSNFVMAPGATQPDMRNMCSPGEAQFPGTNPSASGPLAWLDINPPDFTITGSEFYTLDYTGSNIGILQPVAGLFVDTDAPTISGTCILEDIFAGTTRPVTSIHVTVTAAGDPGTVISEQNVALGSSGEYSIVAPVAAGSYDIYASKMPHWLRRGQFGVSYSGSSLTGVNFSCENGDVNGDNEVGIADYAILSSSYGLFFGDAGFEVNADLDIDDEVGISDYAILSSNYGDFGD